MLKHTRQVYSILDVFGDYGGVVEVLMNIASFLVAPIAAHYFNLKAISKLFLVKTKDRKIFPQRTNLRNLNRIKKEEKIKQ